MGEVERALGPGVAFGAIGDHHGVLRSGALADDVADDERASAIGQVDLVRGLALRSVVEQVVADVVVARARLEQVAAVALVEAAAVDLEARDAADVEEVGQISALPRRLCEQAVADHELGVVEVGGKDAILVVDEDAVEDFQPATLEADAGTVVVGGPCAAELDVVDEEVAVADHPDRLALGDLAIGDQHRAFADAADEQLLLAPGGDVTAVFAGEDLDDVAILCHLGGIGDAVEALAGADAQDLGLGGRNGEGDDDRGKVPCCPAGPRAVTNC